MGFNFKGLFAEGAYCLVPMVERIIVVGNNEKKKESGVPRVDLGRLWNNNDCFISSFEATY